MTIKRIFLNASAVVLLSATSFAGTSSVTDEGELFKHPLFIKHSPSRSREDIQSTPITPEVKKGWVQWAIEKVWETSSGSPVSASSVHKKSEEGAVSWAFNTLKSAVNGVVSALKKEESLTSIEHAPKEKPVTPVTNLKIPQFQDTIGHMNSIPLLLNPFWDEDDNVDHIVTEGIEKYFVQMKDILYTGETAWDDQPRMLAVQKAESAFFEKYLSSANPLSFNVMRQRAKWIAGPINMYAEVVDGLKQKTKENYLNRVESTKKKHILRGDALRNSLFENPFSSMPSKKKHSSNSLRRIWKEKGPQKGIRFV